MRNWFYHHWSVAIVCESMWQHDWYSYRPNKYLHATYTVCVCLQFLSLFQLDWVSSSWKFHSLVFSRQTLCMFVVVFLSWCAENWWEQDIRCVKSVVMNKYWQFAQTSMLHAAIFDVQHSLIFGSVSARFCGSFTFNSIRLRSVIFFFFFFP